MTRALLVGFVFLAAACSNKTFESLCAAQVPAPTGCDTACNPAPGAANSCPGGYHCSADGKCDLFCTQRGGECGDGYTCTADGSCNKNSGGGGSNMPDAPCPALHFTPKNVTPTVELLLDESGSMEEDYGGGMNPPSRLEAMREALVDPTNGVVAKLAGQVVFGATLYTGTGSACPSLQTRARAINNYQPIQRLLAAATPLMDTPTAASIDAVVASFAANPPANGSPKVIVLATDGLPDTCDDHNPPEDDQTDPRRIAANAATVAAAQRAFAAGIRLYFLFIGDAAQTGTHAKAMANAGAGKDPVSGDERFFEATNPAALATAFNTIIGGVVSCDLRLDTQINPGDAANGVVTINNRVLNYPTEWTLDADGITIHILGAACDMLKATANPVVDAAFPCGVILE